MVTLYVLLPCDYLGVRQTRVVGVGQVGGVQVEILRHAERLELVAFDVKAGFSTSVVTLQPNPEPEMGNITILDHFIRNL